MKTQSSDTSLDAEMVLLEMIRKAPLRKRFAFVQSWTASLFEAGSQYARQSHPEYDDEEAKLSFIESQYGKDLTGEIRRALRISGIQIADSPDYQQAIRSLATIFDDLGIPYALSGSLTSSLYGLQRATLHIDIVADLRREHLDAFYKRLQGYYLFCQEEIETAVAQQTCLTLVHLESLLKIIITLPGQLVMGRQVFSQLRKLTPFEGEHAVLALSPEQVILLLLDAFQKSRERADDLWYDLLGIVKVQKTDLDLPFLMQQAVDHGVATLLTRALVDAGLLDE